MTTATATEELTDRLFGATLASLELLSVHLGWRLGLYSTIAAEPVTAPSLAAAAGIDERYATEWLEQQAAAGLLTVDDVSAAPTARRYAMPDGHAEVLVDPRSLSHVAPFAAMIVGIADALPEVVEAYRTGAGVPYTRYGADFRDGQGAVNRPSYERNLAEWIAAMPDIDASLRQDDGLVVDIGCGQGWSTIALAAAYPNAVVVGVDTDLASIDDAIANGKAADSTPTFTFTVDGIEDANLVCIFEALHDMAQPVDVLASAHKLLADGGALLVVDERVEDEFTAPAGEVERFMYGWSVLHCLPASRAEDPSAALGTVLRRPVVHELATEAGFTSVTELPIENDFFRFYRLDA